MNALSEERRSPAVLSDYLTANDLAGQLNVSVRTLNNWHAMGEGPARTRFGRQIYYHRDDVAKWLGNCREAVGA